MNTQASFKCGTNLYDAARAKASSEGYPSFNSYIVALLRLDLLNDDADHATAKKIASMPSAKRDRIDAMMLEKAEQALTQWKASDPLAIAEREVHDRLGRRQTFSAGGAK